MTAILQVRDLSVHFRRSTLLDLGLAEWKKPP